MVALHADKLPRWQESMNKDLLSDIERGLDARSEALRAVLWHQVCAFMATRELLVLPTVSVPPFPVEQPYPKEINGRTLDHAEWVSLTYGITLTGLPAISVPCGFTLSGLPVGLQIVGGCRQETAVLRAAVAFEAAAPWADHRPPGGHSSKQKRRRVVTAQRNDRISVAPSPIRCD
jgi:amidase